MPKRQDIPGVSSSSVRDRSPSTVEGIEAKSLRAMSVQHHPEASPGPHDARHLFARFAQMMESKQ